MLRDYQRDLKNRIYRSFKSGNKAVMAQLPTGGGKTILFAAITNEMVKNERRVLILAHRSELIKQAQDKLQKFYGVHSGVIMADFMPSPFEPVQVASVQTLVRRKLVKQPDLIIIDEAHHAQDENNYGKIIKAIKEKNPDVFTLGVTATPVRTNGAGFRGVFDDLIQGVSVTELVKLGNLTPPRYFVAPLDLGKLKITAGDYNQKELSEAYQKKVHPSQIIENWQKLAKDCRTVGFAVDVEHSKNIVEAFCAAGIKAAHIDGKTEDGLRARTTKQFEKGEIQVLFNVGIFDEGFDCPAIEAVILARPTKSLIKFMQMVGRALRPAPGKAHAIVLDMGGLVAEHDRVEIDRIWTLDGVKKKPSEKELMFRDTKTKELYLPHQLPLDMPMERIELVELTKSAETPPITKDVIKRVNELKHMQQRRGYKDYWVWYQLARDVRKKKDVAEVTRQLRMRAYAFCEAYSYPHWRVDALVQKQIAELYSLTA